MSSSRTSDSEFSSREEESDIETAPGKYIEELVPWETPEVFHKVYKYLYSPELTKKRWAVDEIAVWETRCSSLEAGVEASLVITRAVIQDVLMSNGTSLCQEQDIVMMYGMALVRFVNLMVECHKPDTKEPVASVATRLGIPSWIVALRNEITHQSLPTLGALRIAANKSMEYLDETYWSVELAKEMRMAVRKPFNSEPIIGLLNTYRTLQIYIAQNKQQTEEEARDAARDVESIKKILTQLRVEISRNKKEVLNILTEDGYFVPREEDLIVYLNHTELRNFKYKEDHSHRDLLRLDQEDRVESAVLPRVPYLLQQVWCPLLKVMNRLHVVPEFIELLLYTQGSRYRIGQKILCSWILQILSLHPEVPGVEDDSIKRVFDRGNAMFNWDRLLYAALCNPCKYTPFIIPRITCHVNLKDEHIHHLLTLMAIFQGFACNKNHEQSSSYDCLEDRVFNLPELKKLKILQENKKMRKRKAKKSEGFFTLDHDFAGLDLQNYPIGYTFSPPSCDEVEEDDFEIDATEKIEYTQKYILLGDGKGKRPPVIERKRVYNFEEDLDVIKTKRGLFYKKKREDDV